MAYLHCHSCGWSQDDFWTKGYNPLRFMFETWEEILLEKFNEKFPTEDDRYMTYGEIIAQEMENTAKKIKNMKWHTFEEWKKVQYSAVCPICGHKNFDID